MLSIVIPTLNEEKFLPRLLSSIKKQSFSDYEIIVSDGGSKDNTKKIALENNCQFVEDFIHHHPSWQRNNGAAIARGEILIFLDADTVLQDDFLEKTTKEFVDKKLSGAGFILNLIRIKRVIIFIPVSIIFFVLFVSILRRHQLAPA